MAIYDQWWDSTQAFEVLTETALGEQVQGTTSATQTQWLYSDKGELLGGTTLTGYHLVAEVFDGVSWRRYGQPVLDDGWIQIKITGDVDDTADPTMVAQSTDWVSLGLGRSQTITAIPPGCGREIEMQLVVPVGASTASQQWRVIAEAVGTPTIAQSEVTDLVADLALLAPLADPEFTGTVRGTDGTGTDGAGSDLVTGGGIATGNAASGNVRIRGGVRGTTGTTAQTLVDRDVIVAASKTLTESAATGLCDIAVAAGTVTGGTLWYSIEATDATDYQVLRGRVLFSAVNKAGTLTVTLGTPEEITSLSAGTLTVTVTLATGTNKITPSLNAVSSLTQTVLRATFRVQLDGGTGLVTPL